MPTLAKQYVILDLETSGLDSRNDEIIEVGMVKVRQTGTKRHRRLEVIDRFQSLVKPQKPIELLIQNITGISNELLDDAVKWTEIKQEVSDFIGVDPIVGHNVSFDLDFLKANGVDLRDNLELDTYALATMLVRDAPVYSLGKLCDHLGISFTDQHRALADAEGTLGLFGKLLEMIDDLPAADLESINDFLKGREWSYTDLFAVPGRDDKDQQKKSMTAPELEIEWKQEISELSLEVDAIYSFFAPKGPLAGELDSFEQREGQVEMASSIGKAFQNEDILAIEAGTGVGKSYAYLVPAVFLSTQHQQQVVIATNTLHLQDQLYKKDLPALQQAFERIGIDFRFGLIKGRSHYLCQRCFSRYIRRSDLGQDEIGFVVKILLWLPHTERGEKDELAIVRNEHRWWQQVCSQPKLCSGMYCSHEGEPCFFARAWQEVKGAHLIVTNHAFLMLSQELSSERYRYVILDEAHHLENTITDQYTKVLEEVDFREWLKRLGKKEKGSWQGLFADILSSHPGVAEIEEVVNSLYLATLEALRHSKYFFRNLKDLLALDAKTDAVGVEMSGEDDQVGVYRRDLRIDRAVRDDPRWYEIEVCSEDLEAALSNMMTANEALMSRLADREAADKEEGKLIKDELEQLGEQLSYYTSILSEAVFRSQPGQFVAYLCLNPRLTSVELRSAPLWVGDIFCQQLVEHKKSVILTSATLSVAGSFRFLLDRLGLADLADTKIVQSPFDYAAQVGLYIPATAPQPRDHRYDGWLSKQIGQLIQLYEGRTLVLFTSYSQLRKVHSSLYQQLDARGIQLLSQGIVGTRGKVINTFKENPRSVILGTSSFWEGVDFPGDELRCVIITKIPFDVPTDPLFAARSEQYENPFQEYSVPRAVLKFRQGFGRLIRTSQDSGIVAILDGRVLSQRYGDEFLQSLPPGMHKWQDITSIKKEA